MVRARLTELESGETWILDPATGRVFEPGRLYWGINSRSGYVRLRRPWISKHHGGVWLCDGVWIARDGGSVNRVTVNGIEVPLATGRTALSDGDILGFGETRLRFELLPDAGPQPGGVPRERAPLDDHHRRPATIERGGR